MVFGVTDRPFTHMAHIATMAISGKEAVKQTGAAGIWHYAALSAWVVGAYRRSRWGRGHAFRSRADRAERRLQAAGQHRGAAADRARDDGRCRRKYQCRAVQLLQRGQLGPA